MVMKIGSINGKPTSFHHLAIRMFLMVKLISLHFIITSAIGGNGEVS